MSNKRKRLETVIICSLLFFSAFISPRLIFAESSSFIINLDTKEIDSALNGLKVESKKVDTIDNKIPELKNMSAEEKEKVKSDINKSNSIDEINKTINVAKKRDTQIKQEQEQKKKEIEKAKEITSNIAIPSGDAKEAFDQIVAEKGLSQYEASVWAEIIYRESRWQINATNQSSGAYGLPQALPGNKMSSHGSDWRTNPRTQLLWMYDYMSSRYGGISGAIAFWNANHWY